MRWRLAFTTLLHTTDGGWRRKHRWEVVSVVMLPIVNTSCGVHITFRKKNCFTLAFPAVAAVFVLCRILPDFWPEPGCSSLGNKRPLRGADKTSSERAAFREVCREISEEHELHLEMQSPTLWGFFFFSHERFSSSACEFTKWKSGKQTCSEYGDLLQVSGGSGWSDGLWKLQGEGQHIPERTRTEVEWRREKNTHKDQWKWVGPKTLHPKCVSQCVGNKERGSSRG